MSTKDRGEQLFLSTKDREGPRRAAKNTSFYPRRATKDREGPRRTPLFVHEGHEGPRRAAKNTSFYPRRTRRTAKGREEHLFLSTKDTKDREGPRRTPLFIHEGPRRTAKGRGEHRLWSPQFMVAGYENSARGGPGLTAGTLSYRSLTSPILMSRMPSGYQLPETSSAVTGLGFGGGRCGGTAPAQGRALAPDRPELQFLVFR